MTWQGPGPKRRLARWRSAMSDRDNVLFGLDLKRKTFRSGDGDGIVDEGPQGNRISALPGTEEPTDLTVQKQAQDEVRRHNAELEQQVNIRTAELQAANQVLEAFSYA